MLYKSYLGRMMMIGMVVDELRTNVLLFVHGYLYDGIRVHVSTLRSNKSSTQPGCGYFINLWHQYSVQS